VLKRAVQFYALLLCERHPSTAIPELNLKCQHDREYATDSVRLLLVVVALSGTMLVLVGTLWRGATTKMALLLLSPVALYCCLAPAYLYGKLVKPPIYDSALVQFKTTFEMMPPQSPLGRQGQRQSQATGAKLLTAIVLGRDDKMLTLYVNQLTDCGGGISEYEWVPWQVANGEVIAVREILKLDVIAERFKQSPCPDSPGPN
jgi:hypothetical protein